MDVPLNGIQLEVVAHQILIKRHFRWMEWNLLIEKVDY